jgi:phosphoribosyl 1,2-cyclic phosphodiesterase
MMKIRLHGTRGSYPSSSPHTQGYGGNTPCVEISHGADRIILDAGTGILGVDFDADYPAGRVDIFLTHLHMDHIQGLAFCKPLFTPGREVHLWGPEDGTEPLQARLNRFLSPPLFPIPLRDIPARLQIHELSGGVEVLRGPFKITADYISHPGPTLGFRVECGSRVVAYLPDHEPVIGRPHLYPEDEWVSGIHLARNADLLIHDSQYSKKEYRQKVGWGHSSLNLAAEFCHRAGARHLVLFHHDPAHSDEEITRMFEKFIRKAPYGFPIELARQGQEFML